MLYIITGTSHGLGYEIAKLLVAGNSVIGISRSLGQASTLDKSNFLWVKADLSDGEGALKEILTEQVIPSINGRDFMIVANAAEFYVGEERPPHDVEERILRVNYLMHKVLIEYLKRFSVRRIFIVNSIAGLRGQLNQDEYCASKHALQGYSRSLIKRAKNSDFDVMIINPGGIRTSLWEKWVNESSDGFIPVENLASLIKFMLLLPGRVFVEQFTILPPEDISL